MPIIWVNALWDTGATNTCVSDRLAKEQSLIASNVVKIATGNGIIEVSSYTIHLRFPNGLEFKGLEMPEFKYTHDDCDLILGMDIITQGDFAITNQHGRTRFSFRIPSLHSLDYESGHD